MKTRIIRIKRVHTVIEKDDKGNDTEKKKLGIFTCRVNASVPLDHKQFQSIW